MRNQGQKLKTSMNLSTETNRNSFDSIPSNYLYLNSGPFTYSTYSIPHKSSYHGKSANTYQKSRFTTDQTSQIKGQHEQKPFELMNPLNSFIDMNVKACQLKNKFTSEEVSKLVGSQVKQGSVIKGKSRIEYIPYQKKVIDYETRTYTEMVPKKRTVVDYKERKIVENIPRQAVKQEFVAVQKITQYYKQVVPEKKVQVVPIEKKVKRIEYVPIEKQIVHYPKNEDWRTVQTQSRSLLESQGFEIKSDAEYKPFQPDLLYQFVSHHPRGQQMPVGYVDLGSRRYLSTAPTFSNQNLGSSSVQQISSIQNLQNLTSNLPTYQQIKHKIQQSQVYEQPIFREENLSNAISGNKYEYKYGQFANSQSSKYK